MGDPPKQRKKYSTPSHPWQKGRLEEEKELLKAYGLKNKEEVWKLKSVLKKFAQQAKKLVVSKGPNSEIEKKQLTSKLLSLGLISPGSQLEDILTISPKDIMERRLQTLVYKKNFSRSVRQARQFITHRHITVNGAVVTSPSYLVTKEQEDKVNIRPSSSLFSPDHPERSQLKEKNKPKTEKPLKVKKEAKGKQPR